MDELEFYKQKSARFERALRQIVDENWRSYDGMLSAANWALSEQERVEKELAAEQERMEKRSVGGPVCACFPPLAELNEMGRCSFCDCRR